MASVNPSTHRQTRPVKASGALILLQSIVDRDGDV